MEIEKATLLATAAVQALATTQPDTLATSFEAVGATLDALRQRLEEFGSEQHRVLAEPPAGLLESFASLSESLGSVQAQLAGVDGARSWKPSARCPQPFRSKFPADHHF